MICPAHDVDLYSWTRDGAAVVGDDLAGVSVLEVPGDGEDWVPSRRFRCPVDGCRRDDAAKLPSLDRTVEVLLAALPVEVSIRVSWSRMVELARRSR